MKREIIEGNILIPEFMGYEYIPKDANSTAYQNYGWWKKGTYKEGNDARNNPDFFTISILDLKYHESWDWLMPVLHKAWKVTTEEQREFGGISLFEMGLFSEFNYLYQSVIEFIKWYNQTNKPQ